uniref:Uncharacterized protein n=1 Tax=Rhizophora mucronata TaxID=61149 RepID=A0A2P2QV80_RHIMU
MPPKWEQLYINLYISNVMVSEWGRGKHKN